MATNPNPKPDGTAAAADETAAKTDARIAELEKKLEKANSRDSVVENLQEQLKALQAQIVDMATAKAEAASDAASEEELKSEAEVLRSVIHDARVKIRIASGEGDAEKKAVPVIVNGHMVYIPRDVDAEVPRCAYEALLAAAETKWVTDLQGRPGQPHQVPRFNITFLGAVEKDEA